MGQLMPATLPAPIRQGKPRLCQNYRAATEPSRKHLVSTVPVKDRDKSGTTATGQGTVCFWERKRAQCVWEQGILSIPAL